MAQVEDVLWDLRPAVVKTGMMQNADTSGDLPACGADMSRYTAVKMQTAT